MKTKFANSVIVLLLSILPFAAHSQKKVDTDKKHFSFQYLKAPYNMKYYERDNEHKYTVRASFEPSLDVYFSAEQAEDAIHIPGWQKVYENEYPSILVKFSASSIIAKPEISTRAEKVKDKDGKESNRYHYSAQIVYEEGSISGNLLDLVEENKPLIKMLNKSNKSRVHHYIGPEFRTRREAERDLQANLEPQRINAMKKWFDIIVSHISSSATSRIGWSYDGQRISLIVMDEKKHPENADNVEHYLATRNILENIKAQDNVAQLEPKLQPHIEYYLSILDRYTNTADKKIDLRLRALAFHNLATIYFAMEDYETATEYAIKQIANGYDASNGKGILKDIEDVKKYFSDKDLTTLHPNIMLY